ncbi:putative RNase H-like nuclease [Sinobaca qinghaiensis]|uniref:Putative RNase H-like nuclease n=1 Tax=Sinobaca qinghaiensis TaxID=342944 RepID=A0A419UX08_9BACL|nr:DUF429 domain-containing protein [Sinobaca qinghaiensis]RKD69682.1 putative RNase H-like nuclease [Sinobaca qinghaiensis]
MKAIGLDGCRGGWIAAFAENGKTYKIEVLTSLSQLRPEPGISIWVDMPLGLPAASEYPRQVEALARQKLGKRRSSVFPVPCREVLVCRSYQEANVLHKQLTGAGLQKQTWFLFPKIKEVEAFSIESSVKEAHPEVLFADVYGEPLSASKKTNQGITQRLDLLEQLDPGICSLFTKTVGLYPRKICSRDDIIDASVLAITACHPEWRSDGIDQHPAYSAEGQEMNMRTVKYLP